MIKKYIYKLLRTNNINIAEDVFYYGWTILKYYMIYFLITFPIVCYCHTIHYTVFFLVFYIPLRRYLGGFHFSNNIFCLLTSSLITVISPFIARNCNIHLTFLLSFLYY